MPFMPVYDSVSFPFNLLSINIIISRRLTSIHNFYLLKYNFFHRIIANIIIVWVLLVDYTPSSYVHKIHFDVKLIVF